MATSSSTHIPMDMSDSSSDSSEGIDVSREDGWEDIDPDDEQISFVSLFDEKIFPNVLDMLHYCKDKHQFDIWEIRRNLALDFLGLVKLVNYIRAEVRSGNRELNISSVAVLDDEKYLKPVLDDDAVLYSLDDVFEDEPNTSTTAEVDNLREQLALLEYQFSAYREEVRQALSKKADEDDASIRAGSSKSHSQVTSKTTNAEVDVLGDKDYFSSYSYNSIHELMLKDTIRTDAYRDFIYDNKHIFQDKIVLDVGCGTGILSMFCAKAGAKMVIAVDNSDIIDKARQIIFTNGLQEKVKCLRGKIEEVTLPVPKVDIIISEWMGYCLLYESMLDSVIYARDRYLATDGLMVPSHSRLMVAPLADSELVTSHIGFWKDVYGFEMTGMLEKAYDEALCRVVSQEDIAAGGTAFLELNLHTTKVSDLSFSKPFNITWTGSGETLEGFIVWFDMFFLSSRTELLGEEVTVAKAKAQGTVAFSTGPHSTPTHWQQGVLLIKEPKEIHKPGESLSGEIVYRKHEGQERSLDIEVKWNNGQSSQSWFLN